MAGAPLVSIVMPVKNGAAFLRQALESIAPAIGDPSVQYELVVADGGSVDGTIDLVAGYPQGRIVSTADGGIYDGLNHAIAAAKGEFVVWLNADDLLAPASLGHALRLMSQQPALAMITGDAEFLGLDHPPRTTRQRAPLTIEGALFGIPAVNTRLFRRRTLVDVGPVRTDIGLAGDRELLVRLSRQRLHSIALGAVLYRYRSHPGSATLARGLATRKRIWQAELRLAEKMEAEWGADAEIATIARARAAFARLRSRLGEPMRRATDRAQPRVGIVDTVRGLMLHIRWRGALSGA